MGVLHLAGTGATPPILTKADGLPAAVFAVGAPRPERGGLVVAESSGIRSPEDLRGRGIGLMPVPWHTQFVAAELDAAGLSWGDVRATEIIPVTARDAVLAGHLDAIVVTDPLLAGIEARRPVRILARPTEAFSNRTVSWGPTEVLNFRPEAVTALITSLVASDRATAADPAEAAALLDGVDGHSAERWLPALATRPWGLSAPGPDFLAEQQAHADIFARFGLIPRQIDVADTVDPRHFAAA